MEMTRRRFTRAITGAAVALGASLYWVCQRASPRRIVRALRLGKYPGEIVTMEDILKQPKWSD
jgi:hypothetical protein